MNSEGLFCRPSASRLKIGRVPGDDTGGNEHTLCLMEDLFLIQSKKHFHILTSIIQYPYFWLETKHQAVSLKFNYYPGPL